MHVQKCGGTSIRATLEAALPAGSLAPRRMEPASFASFDDFDRLAPEARAVVAATEAEIRSLADCPVICGHITLPTLATFAPPSRIGTVLREPRARLISYYLFLRFTVALRTLWPAYGIHSPAERPIAEFLAEPRIATVTDNRTCRMLLHGDPRIRDREFIADHEIEPVAEAAMKRLDGLGFVGVLERPKEMWSGLGEFFAADLSPARRNVTGEAEVQPGMLPAPPFDGPTALELLERRSAADATLYRHVVARFEGDETRARKFADAALADGLVRYGAFTSATPARPAGRHEGTAHEEVAGAGFEPA